MRIDVSHENGPFRYLENRWCYPGRHGQMSGFVDFEFRSALLQKMIDLILTVRAMVAAFIKRADVLLRQINTRNAMKTTNVYID